MKCGTCLWLLAPCCYVLFCRSFEDFQSFCLQDGGGKIIVNVGNIDSIDKKP